MHPFSSPFFFNPQFHPCYYSLGSFSLFLFLLLDLPICTLSVATFLFVLLFPFSLPIYLFIHLLFVPFLDGSSSLLLLKIFLQFLLSVIPY
jgi:hypothetical protein